jgi:hypothetical protein
MAPRELQNSRGSSRGSHEAPRELHLLSTLFCCVLEGTDVLSGVASRNLTFYD